MRQTVFLRRYRQSALSLKSSPLNDSPAAAVIFNVPQWLPCLMHPAEEMSDMTGFRPDFI